jgi:hypothetical protein
MTIRALPVLALIALGGCASLDQTAGGSSYETENALTGRIAGSTIPGDTVESLHRGRQTVADPHGRFLLDSLPMGIHVLHGRASGGRAYVLLRDSGTASSGMLRPEIPGEILLDDFEDGDSRNRYGAWLGDGWWWISAAPAVQLQPTGIIQFPARSLVVESSGNTSLHFSAAFTGTSTSEWAEAGVHLGSAPYDLTGLTSIRFRAKGNGTLTVRLVTDGADAGQNIEASTPLDGTWRDCELPISAFQLPAWSGSSVDSAGRLTKLRRCTGLAWAFIADADLWLDDVRLIGASPSALWGAHTPP